MESFFSVLSGLLLLIGCATDRPLSSPKFVLEGFVKTSSSKKTFSF